MSEQQETLSDGRSQRSRTSRAKILEATLFVIMQNARQPSAKEVAEKANVGLRSVFRHFSDMESLLVDLNTLVWARARAKFDLSVERLELPMAERVAALVSLRHQIFREYGNLIHTSSHLRTGSPTVRRQYASLIDFFNTQAFTFIPELRQLDPLHLRHAQTVLSFEFHDYNFRVCNRPIEEVEVLTLTALNLILATQKKD